MQERALYSTTNTFSISCAPPTSLRGRHRTAATIIDAPGTTLRAVLQAATIPMHIHSVPTYFNKPHPLSTARRYRLRNHTFIQRAGPILQAATALNVRSHSRMQLPPLKLLPASSTSSAFNSEFGLRFSVCWPRQVVVSFAHTKSWAKV